jgi:uncharacterized membrane protein YozB (DUF420 family)
MAWPRSSFSVGIFRIKAGDREGHGKAMKWAVITSALFLAVYLASKVHLWVALGRTNVTYSPTLPPPGPA